MNKKRVLFDEYNKLDKINISQPQGSPEGLVTVTDSDTGEVIFKQKPNKIVLAGSIFTLAKHFNITPRILTPTYNSVLGLDRTVNEVFASPGVRREEQVVLFAVGRDGCGDQQNEIFDVKYANWIGVDSIVPFKYVKESADLSNLDRNKYFGRKEITTDTGKMIAYYFKRFEFDVTDPNFGVAVKQQFKDGTPIDENIYSRTIDYVANPVETFIEINMRVTKEDCRDFFKVTYGEGANRFSKINCISLLTAYPKEIEGKIYYQNIRPLTRINFTNEALIDMNKGIDILYQIKY